MSGAGGSSNYYLDDELSWAQRDFGLDRRLVKALAKCGFVYPTVVQSQSLPLTLQGKDILCRAKTGAGKTVAYALPVLQRVLTQKRAVTNNSGEGGIIRSIILAPTKELIRQIHNHMQEMTYYCRDVISVCALLDEDPAVLRYRLSQQPDIVISTPAKLVQQLHSSGFKDGIERRAGRGSKASKMHSSVTEESTPQLDLSGVEVLVLDEADLVLSLGYSDDVHRIISSLPKIFQGILMSATLSPELEKFKRVVLNKPVVLKVEEPKRASQLTQYYLPCFEREKFLVLYVFLKLGLLQGKGLIFINDVNKCYRLKLFLQQFFIAAAVLNSEVPINSRLHIIEEFNRGVFEYLIATDASLDHGAEDDASDDAGGGASDSAHDDGSDRNDDTDDEDSVQQQRNSHQPRTSASKQTQKKLNSSIEAASGGYGVSRGIDFQGVDFVVNFDCPATAAAYTHRVGRTARGTATGTALSFVCNAPVTTSSHPTLTDAEHSEVAVAQRDWAILREVQQLQPQLTSNNLIDTATENHDAGAGDALLQPSLLQFNMKELDTFRYRVEDTLRGVTSAAVKELRAAELKREILNSEKLKNFFAENPTDLKVLRHDKAVSHPIQQKEHLKYVPEYLVPPSMRGAVAQQGSKRNKRKRSTTGSGGAQDQRVKQSKQRNPLYGGETGVDAEGTTLTATSSEPKVYSSNERLGESTSGRQAWKMRHKKGKFNPKLAKKGEHRTPGSFIKSKQYK